MLAMAKYALTIVGLSTLFVAFLVFRATTDSPRLLSPQGCRMSWMSPSYLIQAEFNISWTPLANRYSLLLYREVGWEPNQAMGLPVLFIPGNAGSSHQVRSIASSAARQYYSSPFAVSEEFTGRGVKPIDFYAVEFNEDLSAFHGPTLDSQIAYASAAVKYVLSRYPSNAQIIIMGHSMGGIVGTALLPSKDIKALITMSTPHTLPPARFDAHIEEIYGRNQITLREVETPILSICGGATDMMIPSESCILPRDATEAVLYRRTVFTSALEGAWTGVGHREMVWCHQVRWRVARAALELGWTHTVEERAGVMDQWFRDGQVPPNGDSVRDRSFKEGEYETLPGDMRLALNRPLGKRTYLVPIPDTRDEGEGQTFVLYVSQGSILGVSPHNALGLRASVYVCGARSANGNVLCDSLAPVSLRLLPSPTPGKPFPVPDGGTDESEGVVFFEAELPGTAEGWVGITVNASDDGRGWVAGGFGRTDILEGELNLWNLLLGGARIPLPRSDNLVRKTHISLPHLPVTALLVYRLVPKTVEHRPCTVPPLFSPLLAHTMRTSEIHYYRLVSDQPVFLHSHAAGPYAPIWQFNASRGLDLTIYSSGPSCQDVAEVRLSIDWWASVGRTGSRYPTTLVSWGVGVVSLLLFHSWSLDGQQLAVSESLGKFVTHQMPVLMAVAGVVALFPLGSDYYLGIGNELGVLRAALAIILVGLTVGLVCVSWWLLVALMWPLRLLRRGFMPSGNSEGVGVRRATVISMVLVLALIFLFVPWQVAFLGCWVTQLLNCNATLRLKPYPGSVPTQSSTPTRVHEREPDGNNAPTDRPGASQSAPSHTLKPAFAHAYHQNTHILLLMTWLLPLAAPVLAVWVRTIQTAGYTTPFNGDHNVLKVTPFLALVDLLGRGRPLDMTGKWRGLVRWGWMGVAAIAFLMGGRRGYVVYDVASAGMATLLVSMMHVWFYG